MYAYNICTKMLIKPNASGLEAGVGWGERCRFLVVSLTSALSLPVSLLLTLFLSFFLSHSLSLSFFRFLSFSFSLKGKKENLPPEKGTWKGKPWTIDVHPDLTRHTYRAHARTTRNDFPLLISPPLPNLWYHEFETNKTEKNVKSTQCSLLSWEANC